MKLQTKFLLGIIAVFAALAAAMAAMSIHWVDRYTIREAGHRVNIYIRSSWEIYNAELAKVRAAAELLAQKQLIRDLMRTPQDAGLGERTRETVEPIRRQQHLDLVSLLDMNGRVVLRTRPPYNGGDTLTAEDAVLRQALAGTRTISGTILLSEARLEREGEGLVARCRQSGGEPRGMMITAVVPVQAEGVTVGMLQVGSLLNGAESEVDTIRDAIFVNEQYAGKPLGTATIFMGDTRISTNVRDPSGKRAVGTHAAAYVADRVLKQGQSWSGRAWVVDTWYLSQYDPLRDPDGRIIGMLYVGELEQKYLDIRRHAVLLFMGVIGVGMLLALLVVYGIARGILGPVRHLSAATHNLGNGDLAHRVPVTTGDEVGDLARAFNEMARRLEEQRREIERDHQELAALNAELKTTNRNYMEMLGFVTHELKNPLASATLSIYTVKDGYVGELNERQRKLLESVATSLDYFGEMIRNYLDLARLEKGELAVHRRSLNLQTEILAPVLDGLERSLEDRGMPLENRVAPDFGLEADRDLLRIVYDNLLSNAIKYGRTGGRVTLDAGRDASGEIRLSVTNEGPGIPPEKVGDLFRKFSRLDTPEQAGKRGTGLGLFICREILEKHGGRIWVESESGQWVRFCVALPGTGRPSLA